MGEGCRQVGPERDAIVIGHLVALEILLAPPGIPVPGQDEDHVAPLRGGLVDDRVHGLAIMGASVLVPFRLTVPEIRRQVQPDDVRVPVLGGDGERLPHVLPLAPHQARDVHTLQANGLAVESLDSRAGDLERPELRRAAVTSPAVKMRMGTTVMIDAHKVLRFVMVFSLPS